MSYIGTEKGYEYVVKKSKIQRAWNKGKVVLWPRLCKKRNRVENWRPITLITHALSNKIKFYSAKLGCRDSFGSVPRQLMGINLNRLVVQRNGKFWY
jgi:hypothetical protein